MKKINKKMLIITGIACLLPILLGIVFYSSLPESIAIHFDIENNPNNYFSKPAFVFGMPFIMLGLQVFCCIVSDLADSNPDANKKTVTVYKWIIPILSILLYSVTILYAMGKQIDIRRMVMCILGVMFIVIGNYIPKTSGNSSRNLIKIKDEKLNKKMLRISGYLLILDGILCMGSMLGNSMLSVAVIGITILQVVVLCGYSIVKNKKKA